MDKLEFENLLSESRWLPVPSGQKPKKPHYTLTPEEWDLINLVYMYYPTLSSNADVAKPAVVELYNTFGIAAFEDLVPRAKAAMNLEAEITALEKKKSQYQEALALLKDMGTLEVVEKHQEVVFNDE